jgi:hypothetical protein
MPAASDPHSLIFKRKPIRHIKPTRPAAGDIAVRIQLAPDAVKPPILTGRIVHHQNEQLQTSIAVQVRERDGAVLIFKRKPIRDSDPRPPAAGKVPIRIQSLADPVKSRRFDPPDYRS